METSDLAKQLKANSNWYRIRNIDDPEEVIRLWVSCAHCEQPLIDEELSRRNNRESEQFKTWPGQRMEP